MTLARQGGRVLAVRTVAATMLLGCREVAAVAPQHRQGVEAPAIEVSVLQEGVYLSRGLALVVDDAQAVTVPNPVRDRVALGLGPGEHRVRLTGLEPNCRVIAGASRSVTVLKDEAAGTEFRVICLPDALLRGLQTAAGPPGVGRPLLIARAPGGSRLAIRSPQNPGRVLLDSGTGGSAAVVTLPRSAWSVTHLAWSPDESTLAILAADSAARAAYLWTPSAGAVALLEWVAPANAGGSLDWTPDGTALVVGNLAISTDCAVVAVVPVVDPAAWRPLLPCQGTPRIRDVTLTPRLAQP